MNKNILKEKNYFVPTYLLNIVKTENLNLNELLLLMFFINDNLVFDIKLITDSLKLNEADVLQAFDGLIKKNLISLATKKNDMGKIEEFINIDPFYDKVVMDLQEEEQEEVKNDIFSIFETEFGRPLSSTDYEIIKAWIEKGVSEELVIGALKEAVYNGVPNLRYIDKIIYEWQRKGYKTMKDINNHNSSITNKEESVELFDYNWLDDDN